MASSRGQKTGKRIGKKNLARLLLASSVLGYAGGMVAAVPAAAQQSPAASSGQSVRFDIPAQPLSSAVNAFIRATGWQISYSSALVSGKTSRAVSGTLTSAQALQRLVAGTGIVVVVSAPGSAALASPAATDAGGASDGSTSLETITVDGQSESAWGPVNGLVAERSATGTKTDTAIIDTPASISVVGETEVERRGVKNLDQALAYTSGVTTNDYGADNRYDFFTIRGFDETGKGVYRDGLQMRTNNFMGSRMEPYGMQRIEVLKGSTSTLYGLNAPGGLVNMVTKRPQDHKFGEVYTTFGEDHAETGTDFGGPLDENGNWSYRITAKWQDADEGPDWARDDRLYIAPAVTWNPTDATTLTFLFDYNKRNGSNRYGIPVGSGIDSETFLGEPEFEKNDTVEKNIGYVFEHDFENGLIFRSNARYTHLDLSHESVYFGASAPPQTRLMTMAVDGELDRFVIDNNIQYDASFGRFDSRTLLGMDYSWTDGSEYREDGVLPGLGPDLAHPVYCGRACISVGGLFTQNPFVLNSVTTGTERTVGTYVQEELTLDDRWILTLGARYDNAQSDALSVNNTVFGIPVSFGDTIENHALTKRAGLTFKATENLSLYGSYSESFVPVAPIVGSSGFIKPPKPMEGTLYEAGVKYRPDGMDALFTAAVFDLTQSNVPYAVSPTARDQIGEIAVRGVELEGKAALTDRLNLTLAYTFLDSEIVREGSGANNGNRTQFIPEHMGALWLDYTIPGNETFGDVTLGVGARFVGSRFADNANTVKLNSYTVFDAALNYRITESATLAVNVTNLFDREYISHVETWSNPDTAFYGDRRAVKATLKYTW
ncbi:TonB-dependent siderophore receptor [Shinella zoogloeoides]|uniref:TonB-dependent siderophore receptor n=1 Tax=Shinella zoogloeoides TaxID=352475 RepID=UPI0028A6B7C8|nr:TonB-dependent siderophore receptor [Shinella zoogloeoides]